jgi:hypothetical protein
MSWHKALILRAKKNKTQKGINKKKLMQIIGRPKIIHRLVF